MIIRATERSNAVATDPRLWAALSGSVGGLGAGATCLIRASPVLLASQSLPLSTLASEPMLGSEETTFEKTCSAKTPLPQFDE